MSKNNILIPIDFSEQSLTAVSQSYNLAKHTGSTLTLLHVSDSSDNEAKKRLDKLAQDVTEKSGLQTTTMIVKGSMYQEVIKVAEQIDAIAIITGYSSSKDCLLYTSPSPRD